MVSAKQLCWVALVAMIALGAPGAALAGGRSAETRSGQARRTVSNRHQRRALRPSSRRRRRRLGRTRAREHRARFRAGRRRAKRRARRGLLSKREANRFLHQVLARERRFYRPGVAWDRDTGLTYDGHPVDIKTGQPYGSPRNWSAASKESLHILLLVKAIDGDRTARELLSPDPTDPSRAVPLALDVLERKIETYEAFDRDNPGFGGFLPWFSVKDGKMVPSNDYWDDKVPSLDNGQLAWSLYVAAHSLRDHGHKKLAARYRRRFDLMRKNVVRIFYDRDARQFRAESRIARTDRAPEDNRYTNPQKDYLLDDPYEGLMLVHFADLFGDWGKDRAARESVWREPRRRPATYEADGRRITVARGHWFSSHEAWGFLVLPFRDLPLADRLFENGQRVRTLHSAREGYSGLFASTQQPVRKNTLSLEYLSAAGIQQVAGQKVQEGEPVFTPYAAFPLALADKQVFATWLRSMLYRDGKPREGVYGPLGIGESYTESGRAAPVVTWDGKGLIAAALMGGITDEVRADLKRDGKYGAFMRRVREDYSRFEGVPIEGEKLPYSAPHSPEN